MFLLLADLAPSHNSIATVRAKSWAQGHQTIHNSWLNWTGQQKGAVNPLKLAWRLSQVKKTSAEVRCRLWFWLCLGFPQKTQNLGNVDIRSAESYSGYFQSMCLPLIDGALAPEARRLCKTYCQSRAKANQTSQASSCICRPRTCQRCFLSPDLETPCLHLIVTFVDYCNLMQCDAICNLDYSAVYLGNAARLPETRSVWNTWCPDKTDMSKSMKHYKWKK